MTPSGVYQRIQRIKAQSEAPKAQYAENAPIARSELERLRDKLVKHRERFTGKRTLPTVPGVQSLSIATRYLEGGRDRFFELVQNAVLHRHESAEKWWFVYADLTSSERLKVNFDDLCAASGVSPKELLIAVLSTEMDFSRDVSDLIRASLLPKITSVLVQSAQRKDSEIGERDRARYLQSMNVLPAPKGTVIQVSANAAAAASAAMEPSVPSFAEDMKMLRRVPVIDVSPVEPE